MRPLFLSRVAVATLLILVMSIIITTPDSHAAPNPWRQVSVTGHGIRLTLSVRNRSYPHNALVKVWARMQNRTHHTVYLWDSGPQAAGKYIPQAVVLAARGGTPLPIALTDYVPYPGPAPLAIPLLAGAVHNIPELIILRGPVVHLDLTLTRGKHLPALPGTVLSTPAIRVSLTAPDTPGVTLQTPPSQPGATIAPAGPVHGPLLAEWSEMCAGGNSFQQMIYWTKISEHLTPTCTDLIGWHEIAGWLNHSVAQWDWGVQ